VNGTVELFCNSEGTKVPGVAVVVNILKIATNCDGFVGGDTVVDGVYTTSERIDVDFEVGECFI
jgi:hypothetical protein